MSKENPLHSFSATPADLLPRKILRPKLEVEFACGAHFEDAVESAFQVAHKTGCNVEFNFNGSHCFVSARGTCLLIADGKDAEIYARIHERPETLVKWEIAIEEKEKEGGDAK